MQSPLLKIHLCIVVIISTLQRELHYVNSYSFLLLQSQTDSDIWFAECLQLSHFLALQIQEAICYLYILLGTNTIQSPLKQLNFGSYPSILS